MSIPFVVCNVGQEITFGEGGTMVVKPGYRIVNGDPMTLTCGSTTVTYPRRGDEKAMIALARQAEADFAALDMTTLPEGVTVTRTE